MLGNDVKYKRKKYGARGAQIDLAHGRCSHHPQKSQVPIGTFLGKFLSFFLVTVGLRYIFLLWNEAVQKTITTFKTIYRGTFVQKMGTVAPVV